MKKNRKYLLTIFISLGFLFGIPVVHAESISNVEDVDLSNVSIGDKFKVEDDTYKVTEIKKDEIYIGSIHDRNKLDIYHFEIDVYKEGNNLAFTNRKFVKLEDLCSKTYKENGKSLNICEATQYTSKNTGVKINIQRQYANKVKDTMIVKEDGKFPEVKTLDREIYYSTDHELGTDSFKSLVYVNNGKGSTINSNEELDDEERGNFYYFNNTDSDDPKNEKFNSDGILTGDVETLIDNNNDIYISIRFLSEALGARVDWLKKKINNNTDAVLIRFYDSDSYCKEYEINFTEYNKDFKGMYEKFLTETKSTHNEMSFDLSYKYRSNEGTKTGNAKWKKLFLGGYAATNGFVSWDADRRKVVFKNDSSKPSDISSEDFQKICPDDNYDTNGQLTTLDGCIEVYGLINYYGVPIPINLLKEENDVCKFNEDYFEEDDVDSKDDYDDDDSDYDYDDTDDDENYSNNEYITYVIGDVHVQNISKIYKNNDIEYRNVNSAKEFSEVLNNISNDIKSNKNYRLIFHMGNSEIFNIESSNKTDELKQEEISDLASTYAKIYSDFLNMEKVDKKNVSKYIIENTPNQNGWNLTTNFYSELVLNIKSNELDYINDNKNLYCTLKTDYIYNNNKVLTNIKYGGNVLYFTDKINYTTDTYKNLVNYISNCIDTEKYK